MAKKQKILIKRAYLPFSAEDGYCILVDRLWPRGIRKESAPWTVWVKAIAPSDDLRKWFSHDPEKWAGFQKKYKEEVLSNQEALKELKSAIKGHAVVTLVYAAKDTLHNNAVVLQQLLT